MGKETGEAGICVEGLEGAAGTLEGVPAGDVINEGRGAGGAIPPTNGQIIKKNENVLTQTNGCTDGFTNHSIPPFFTSQQHYNIIHLCSKYMQNLKVTAQCQAKHVYNW